MTTTFFTHPDPGFLQISGKDRVDFVQRQTTNDVALLAPKRSVTTVLTDPAARIIDVFQLIAIEDEIGLITILGRASITANFLKRRIFFNDEVSLTDKSAEMFVIDVDGPDALSLLAAAGIRHIPALNEVLQGTLDGEPVYVIGQRGLHGVGSRVLGGVAGKETLLRAFTDAGGEALTSQAYDRLRIEAGLPAAPELSEAYTPLETRLDDAISHTKGCYTGQEILARQITYDKVTRKMVGLRLNGMAKSGNAVKVDGKKAGTITSVAESPQHGPIALAVIKRAMDETGTKVTVDDSGTALTGEIAHLPFAQ